MDEIVIVGGLVPVLWGEARKLQPDALAPVGTVDVDVGIAVSLLEQERYREIAERLLRSGFVPDSNDEGNPTPQRWIFGTAGPTVDFLIEPTSATEVPGRIKHLDEGHKFGALLAVGIDLALLVHTEIRLEQETLQGERASRVIRVCDAGPFVVLKAIAFRGLKSACVAARGLRDDKASRPHEGRCVLGRRAWRRYPGRCGRIRSAVPEPFVLKRREGEHSGTSRS